MKKTLMIAALLALGFTALGQNYSVTWTTDPVDSHRTGVVASNASNVSEAMGTMKGKKYIAPNGRVFKGGSTPKAAKIMIDAQPAMAQMKEVIGYCPEGMSRRGFSPELFDWYMDELMRAVQDSTGKKVDVAIGNRGGVRCDMPKGDVFYDDIMSMFPFKNKICYVALRGRDLRAILEGMAEHHMEIIGGVKVVVKDHKLFSAKIDGQPIDDDKLYGLATIDFLLDGGDGLHLAKNNEELILCNGYLYDTMIPYVRSLTAAGKPIQFESQNWITMIGGRGER